MHTTATRRELLLGASASGAALLLTVYPADATPESLQAAIRKVSGNAEIGKGKVKLDIPLLVENGNTVPMSVSVESPMTANDYVKAIHVFNEKNPHRTLSVFISDRAPARPTSRCAFAYPIHSRSSRSPK